MAKKSAQRREKGTAEEAIWMPAPRSFIRSELVLTSKSLRDITIAEKGKWNFGAGNEMKDLEAAVSYVKGLASNMIGYGSRAQRGARGDDRGDCLCCLLRRRQTRQGKGGDPRSDARI